MKRKVWLDNERFVECEIEDLGGADVYTCPSSRLEEVAEALERNGAEVTRVNNTNSWVTVDRTKYKFLNEVYTLNQCEDLIEWFKESRSGEFTYYYQHIVFHVGYRFLSAYRDDINNYIEI